MAGEGVDVVVLGAGMADVGGDRGRRRRGARAPGRARAHDRGPAAISGGYDVDRRGPREPSQRGRGRVPAPRAPGRRGIRGREALALELRAARDRGAADAVRARAQVRHRAALRDDDAHGREGRRPRVGRCRGHRRRPRRRRLHALGRPQTGRPRPFAPLRRAGDGWQGRRTPRSDGRSSTAKACCPRYGKRLLARRRREDRDRARRPGQRRQQGFLRAPVRERRRTAFAA